MRIAAFVIGTLFVVVALAAQSPDEPDVASYGIGFYLGEEVRTAIQSDGVGVDLDVLTKGLRDALEGREPMASREDLDGILTALHLEMERRMVQRLLAESPDFKKAYDENRQMSEKFHTLFADQPGVVTLPSGNQYKELRPGTGRRPQVGDTVVVSGRITLLDGTVLHESKDETLRVGDSIEGGNELLTLMPTGAKWQIAVPPQLAHGEAGRYPIVGPNETIVGIVELVEVK